MSMTLLWALICLIIFIAILAHPKLPNWMTFICLAPVALFSGIMESGDIYAVLNSSSLHLMIIICMFSGMIAATGLDVVIGEFVDRVTSSQTGKKKEMMIFAIVYITSGLVSTVLQNSYVALAFLPVLRSIARKNRISLSKLVLFVIFSTTLGGAVTLIGTPTNVYANTALEEAGLQLFGMLDFAWVAIPIFIIGGIYMIARKVISPRIPLIYIGTTAVFIFLFGGFDINYTLCQVFAGGLIFGAFFMATDYVTSPITPKGQVVYGVVLGVLTGIFRLWGASPEGVSYAIILSNLLVPMIEKVTLPTAFGKEGKKA